MFLVPITIANLSKILGFKDFGVSSGPDSDQTTLNNAIN